MDAQFPYRQEREELERVLSSGIFPRAPLQVKLLKFICEEYFAGRASRIKEYVLATEVFGRSQDFDQNQDAIVRVEAHRLRKNLREYYLGKGANNLVQIVIEPGHYVPKFVARDQALSTKPNGNSSSTPNQTSTPAEGAQLSVSPVPLGVGPPRRWIFRAVLAVVGLALVITVVFLRRGRDLTYFRDTRSVTEASASAAAPPVAEPLDAVRILAGYTRGDYIDRQGNRWSSDRYFTGGEAGSRPHQFIVRTADSQLYEQWRRGDFSYDIPLKPGAYELHLHFVEPEFGPDSVHGGGETSRLFSVFAAGDPLLVHFDILEDAGRTDTADERVFTNVHPSSDGYLHLRFPRETDTPLVCALEVIPCAQGKMRPVRIITGDTAYTDHDGNIWLPDRYSDGGRSTNSRASITNTPDPGLYLNQRFGSFNYSIPVAVGSKYTATLHFAETFFGPTNSGGAGAGSRVFDVFCNGNALLRDFDIFREAGGENRAVAKTFHGLVPNAQGKLFFDFVPNRNYPRLGAIEVAPE